MKARFEGEAGHRRLIETLTNQRSLSSNQEIASLIAAECQLLQVAPGAVFIEEGGSDDDVFFILTGKVDVLVKGRKVAERAEGQHIGEMAAIDPALPRSASCVAQTECLLAKLSEAQISKIANDYPIIWRNFAKELARRLHQRNDLIAKPNEKPRLFVIPSSEALKIARGVQSSLRDILVIVWTDGVFFASGYALDVLEAEVDQADFAVAIAQPDDVVESRGKSSSVARDNVVFELGLFMGRLGRPRTLLLQPAGKELKLPSDLHGLTAISYKEGSDKDLPSLLGPACTEIRRVITNLGVRN